jgi:alkanesulfonate monooxygenase SsuD/methylene tetrahydromethanopterin reductase-like flavin-dependent oxidoreductase (luciferase family)
MTRKLTFGYLYDFRNPEPWRRPWPEFYAETLDFVAWTEGLGFDGAWVPEHHGASDGYVPSPLVALAAMAARTSKIRLGSAVALAPLYNPVRFAEDCALVDILSNGRLELALGVGYRRRETDALGVGFKSRGARTDEFLEILRRLWAGESVTHQGRHFNLKDATIMPRPVRDIPLYIGGFSDRALDRAVRYGVGFHGAVEIYPAYADKLRAAGKDPAEARLMTQSLFFYVAKDPQAALEELLPHALQMNNSYGEWLSEDIPDGGAAMMQPMTLEAFRASGLMQVVTPDVAIRMLEKMRARAPVDHYIMMVPPGMPLAKFAKYAELLAKEVMPAFA